MKNKLIVLTIIALGLFLAWKYLTKKKASQETIDPALLSVALPQDMQDYLSDLQKQTLQQQMQRAQASSTFIPIRAGAITFRQS